MNRGKPRTLKTELADKVSQLGVVIFILTGQTADKGSTQPDTRTAERRSRMSLRM